MNRLLLLTVALLVIGAGSTGLVSATDSDGVSLLTEFSAGTDPFDPDTDEDTLADGTEQQMGSNPLENDTDGDGLHDGKEQRLGTRLTDIDTDGDSLTDDDEHLRRGTDPTTADTDEDTISDRGELVHGTDPTDMDTDSDTLPDPRELELGTDPTHPDTDNDRLNDSRELGMKTDPVRNDTDTDQLSDGAEILSHESNPVKPDTDSDGLIDGIEVNEHNTDPTTGDTDGDGFTDRIEVMAGSDSVLSGSDPLRKDVYVELDHMTGTDVSPYLDRVEKVFANAPVKNPDGSTGITLHIRRGETVRAEAETTIHSYARSYYRDNYELDGYGYYHAVVVEELGANGVIGVTRNDLDGFLVEEHGSEVIEAKTFVHELGHQLGLMPNVHSGIDSRKLTERQYPSIMNYRRLSRCTCEYGYSAGENGPKDFDDWGYITSHLPESQPDTGELRHSFNETSS